MPSFVSFVITANPYAEWGKLIYFVSAMFVNLTWKKSLP